MKTQFVGIVITTLLASASLYAQNPLQLEFSAPFAFHIGEKKLPAGTYTVDRAGIYVVVIRSTTSGDAAMAGTMPASTRHKIEGPKLAFNRYGDRYFLSQIWHDGADGQSLRKSRAEKGMEVNFASVERHTVIARQIK